LNSPAEEIVPQSVVHADGTLAVNCLVAFSCTVTMVGDTVTAKAGKHVRRTKMAEGRRDSARFTRISEFTALW
jgi:hypothetical protein